MKHTFRKKSLILLLIAVFAVTAGAQKLKEKKDIVYLDDAPQYKLLKTKGSLLKGFWYEVHSMEGDTLVRFDFKSINMPNMPNENIGYFWSYYEVHFVKSGKTAETDYTGKGNIMDMLQAHRVIENGQVSAAGEDKFISGNETFQNRRMRMDSAAANRTALLKDRAYLQFAKNLHPRPRGDEKITVSPGAIMSGTAKVADWKLSSDNDYGTTYHLLDKTNKMAASVFYEKAKKRVYVVSMFDKKGKEYFISGPFTNADFAFAVEYLVNFGYL